MAGRVEGFMGRVLLLLLSVGAGVGTFGGRPAAARRKSGWSRIRRIFFLGVLFVRLVIALWIVASMWSRLGDVNLNVGGEDAGAAAGWEIVVCASGRLADVEGGLEGPLGIMLRGDRIGSVVVRAVLSGTAAVGGVVRACAGASEVGRKRFERPSIKTKRFSCARRFKSKPYNCKI